MFIQGAGFVIANAFLGINSSVPLLPPPADQMDAKLNTDLKTLNDLFREHYGPLIEDMVNNIGIEQLLYGKATITEEEIKEKILTPMTKRVTI